MPSFDHVAQVRVPRASGGTGVGSGLLIAERLVLTAGHVVDGAVAAIGVAFPFAGVEATGTVVWRGGDAGFDAALVELGERPLGLRFRELRWGRLTGQRPGVAASATGFPRVLKQGDERVPDQVDGAINPGTARGERYDVRLAGPHPLAAAEDPSPWAGLSGAALLSGERVVGVVVIDTPGFRSGRLTAVPAWRLLAEPGFRAALQRHGGSLTWESVELAPLFARTRARLDSPASLLRADTAVVRFRGRGELLAELRAWCEGPADVAGRLLVGPGGQGKTRLARQLGLALDGWVTGFLSESAPREAAERLRESRLPVLVVVDYAETRPEQVRALTEAAAEPASPVRILLLARAAGEWWSQLLPRIRTSLLVDRAPESLSPVDDDVAGRRGAYDEAFADLSGALAALPGYAPRRSAAAPDLRSPAYGSILTVQLQALIDLLTTGADAAPAPEQLEDVLLEHEQLYWGQTAARRGLVEPAFQPDTLRRAVAVATLCGAADEDEALATVTRLPGLADKPSEERRGIARWLADLYPSGEGRYWGSLQPDRVGEHLVARVERDRPGLVAAALTGATPPQQSLALTVLARAVTHQPSLVSTLRELLTAELRALGPLALPVALAAAQPQPLVDAVRAAVASATVPGSLTPLHDALPYQSLLFAELSLELAERLADLFRALAETDPGHLPSLANALNTFSNRLGQAGRHSDALAPVQEAVGVYRELTENEPDLYRVDLAMSLNNLSNRLSRLGRHEDAVPLIREVVQIRRALADRSALATALNNLSVQLAAAGRTADAPGPIVEAVEIRRELAESAPAAQRPDLAQALNNLSLRLGAVGQHDAALAAIQEAVQIRRELVQSAPDSHLLHLAHSLGALSIRLADAGRRDEALAAIDEAVEIHRALADAAPDAHLPELAGALNTRSNRLAELGRPADALAPIEEAVQIWRPLAEATPGAYRPALATALNNLSNRLADLGQPAEALAAIEESLRILRALAAVSPHAHLSELARSLHNLSVRLGEIGRYPVDVLAPIEEAVQILRTLAGPAPDAYAPQLAHSLDYLARTLTATGQRAEALAPLAEAVDVYRALAEAAPGAYGPNLAVSLYNLGLLQLDQVSPGEADPSLREAIAVYRVLAAAQPDTFLGDLRDALHLGLQILEHTGRDEEAASVRRELAAVEARLAG